MIAYLFHQVKVTSGSEDASTCSSSTWLRISTDILQIHKCRYQLLLQTEQYKPMLSVWALRQLTLPTFAERLEQADELLLPLRTSSLPNSNPMPSVVVNNSATADQQSLPVLSLSSTTFHKNTMYTVVQVVCIVRFSSFRRSKHLSCCKSTTFL